ncbi:MAG: LytR/AlgR family response regulator transcription factor [Thermoanaerobaculia bacterium]
MDSTRSTEENDAGNPLPRGLSELVLQGGEDELRDALSRLFRSGSPPVTVSVRWRAARYALRLPIRPAEGVIRYIAVGEVDWIEAANQYAKLHVGKKGYLVREPMARLASWLDPERFQRIHRSAIVRLDGVAELRSSPPRAVLRGGAVLPVSPQRWTALQAALSGLP